MIFIGAVPCRSTNMRVKSAEKDFEHLAEIHVRQRG